MPPRDISRHLRHYASRADGWRRVNRGTRVGVEQHEAGGGAWPQWDADVGGEAAEQFEAAFLGDGLPWGSFWLGMSRRAGVWASVGFWVMSLAVALSDAFASRPDPAAVPAASIAVAVDQQTVIEAWGAKTSTLFQAASISKPVAAMVALRLVADGHLDLDADVNRFRLPGTCPATPG